MIEDVIWKIKYDKESTSLDFKKKQYTKEKYDNFIKDVMSMANAPGNESRYIVIGVKEHLDGKKDFHSVDNNIDIATYEQLIRNNIEPTINIEYTPLKFDSFNLGVFEIKNCIDPPYIMKKDRQTIKKGDCFIRRGTQQEKMTRRDLDEMLEMKSKYQFINKISFGFEESFLNKTDISAKRTLSWPSERKKKDLEDQLNELVHKENLEESQGKNTLHTNNLFDGLSVGLNGVFPKRKETKEALKKQIDNVKNIYYDYDIYYLEETVSHKINFFIYNNSKTPLDKVEVILNFPTTVGRIADDLPSEPLSNTDLLAHTIRTPVPFNGYPYVEKVNSTYIVTEDIEILRHKQIQPLFTEDLRIFVPEINIGKSFTVNYEIHAVNLPDPVYGELIINVI